MLLHHETAVFSSISALIGVGLTGLVAALRSYWKKSGKWRARER